MIQRVYFRLHHIAMSGQNQNIIRFTHINKMSTSSKRMLCKSRAYKGYVSFSGHCKLASTHKSNIYSVPKSGLSQKKKLEILQRCL
jgi:hypothetical protein